MPVIANWMTAFCQSGAVSHVVLLINIRHVFSTWL